MQPLANKMGWGYLNADAQGISLSNPYFNGTVKDQIVAAAQAANITWNVVNNVLQIKTPFGNYDQGATPIAISPSKGMVGYPTLSSSGMMIKTLFNPDIHIGRQVKISGSQIVAANGTWTANSVSHELESIVPNGRWFTNIGVFSNGSGTGT
jgi:hypothetical protein